MMMTKHKIIYGWLKHSVRKLLVGLVDKPLPPPSTRESALTDELREVFRSFPKHESESTSSAEITNTEFLNRLQNSVLTKNPREFLRWDVIQEWMFAHYAHYTMTELNHLRRRPDWESRWQRVVK